MLPPKNMFVTCETIDAVVGVAVGYGSRCWENGDSKSGTFQSEEASACVGLAVARIHEILTTPNPGVSAFGSALKRTAEGTRIDEPIYASPEMFADPDRRG